MTDRRLKFIVIGAQKAGTTWLHANLSGHPGVAFPPLKEFFYFNEIDAAIPTTLRGRRSNNHWLNIKWKQVFKQQLIQALLHGELSEMLWYVRYLTVPRKLDPVSLTRYDKLFPAVPDKISGDITPNYSVLSQPTVEAIANFYPDAKIIFILRNPVERSWSQAKMNLGLLKGRKIQDVPGYEIAAYLSSDRNNEQLSDYRATLQRWTACYSKEQLFLGFYDDLNKDPVAFYRSVLAFLQLEDTYDPDQLARVVYQGSRVPIPPEYKQLLSLKFRDQLTYLADFFQNYPVNFPLRWLKDAELTLRIHPSSA